MTSRKAFPKGETAIDFAELDRRSRVRGDTFTMVNVADPDKVGASHQVGAGATTVAVRVSPHPLDRLWARSQISRRQFEAGDKLRNAYERAFCGGKSPDGMSVTSISYGARSMTDAQLDASLAVREALKHVGASARQPLQWVVLEGEDIKTYALAVGVTQHNAKGRLDLALDLLADQYGL